MTNLIRFKRYIFFVSHTTVLSFLSNDLALRLLKTDITLWDIALYFIMLITKYCFVKPAPPPMSILNIFIVKGQGQNIFIPDYKERWGGGGGVDL